MSSVLFSPDSRDPWTKLKAEFTGLKFMMSLIPVIIFVFSLLLKAYAGFIYGTYAAIAPDMGLKSLCTQEGTTCSAWPIWKIFTGL
jgi:hypothetical protein